MRALCLATTGEALADVYLTSPFGLNLRTDLRLTVNKEYVVYAVAFDRGGVWYYIIDDAEPWYPTRYPAPLFQVIDGRMPAVWQFSLTPSHHDHLALLAPSVWAHDPYFYDRLTDGAPREVAEFSRLRKMMDAATTAP